MKRFRSEIFDLCKVLSSMDQFDNLRETLASLRFTTSDSTLDPKKDVCNNGILLRAEFYGLLLAYQNKLTSFPDVTAEGIALTEKEFTDISYGYCYISRFIELCLEDISNQNRAIGQMLSPYSFFRPVLGIPNFDIDTSVFDSAVRAFKDSSVYHGLMDTNLLLVFSNAPEESIRNLFGALYRDVIQAPIDTISNDILAFKVREQSYKPNQQVNPVDALQIISFKLLALREMLSAAASLLYDAILGSPLVVIDENNLINIEKNASNTIYSYKTILIQGGLFCPFNDILNIVFLLTINNGKATIHEFGRARSSTFNFTKGNGDTTKLSFCILDEELNPISNLTTNYEK